MKFQNKGETMKIRLGEAGSYYWVTLKHGEKMELPNETGKSYGLTEVNESNQESPKVTEGQIGKTKVETKQFEDDFLKELTKIKGIGKKTAKDIQEMYGREELIEAVKSRKHISVRDDIELKLRKKYGK